MNKNSKFLFLGLTLMLLLISVGAISATDNNTQDIISDNTLNPQDTTSNNIVSTNNTKSYKDIKVETKNSKPITNKNVTKKIIQTDKQTKKSDIQEQTVTDYNTLKEAWNKIQDNGDTTTQYIINVKKGNYIFDEVLDVKEEQDTRYITLNGEDVNTTIFDGQNKTRLLNINSPNQIIKINNITFTNGYNGTNCSTQYTGGVIYSNSQLDIINSKFENNHMIISTSTVYGSVLYTKGTLKVMNSSFINNSLLATESRGYAQGVGIYFDPTNLTHTCDITHTSFINNTLSATASRGGAIAMKGSNLIKVTILNCNFEGNSANYTASDIYVGTSRNRTINFCVFNTPNKKYMDYLMYTKNYFINDSKANSGNNLIFTINNKYPGAFNQRVKNLEIKYVIEDTKGDLPINSLGFGYVFNITSSSNLINTTGITLSPENNYTTNIDVSNLPVNHENITLSINNEMIANLVYDYTNVIFNNITAKPGQTIKINATFKTSDNKLIPNGRVAFKINGKTLGYGNIKFGTASFNYTIPSNYTAKNYTLNVSYGGNKQFIEARANTTLKLEKLNTKPDVKTKIEGNTLKIEVNPTDENNKTVTRGKICVKLNGKTLKTLNINGKTIVNYTIPKSWNNHQIKVLAIYGENSQYKTSRNEITTKITLPKNKETKKEDQVTNNYYVSSENGLDTNPGTQTSPFKTIQKAITTINTNKQVANVYLNGTFKGVGNTNLTIPGNLKINFIGVGNSSIDGEVNYTYKSRDELDADEYYWLSSAIWHPYNNGKGNWAMNITEGNGLITIKNLTIKNGWNSGISNIESYVTGTVTNYGNLEVDNVSFIFNHGGVGAAIKNNNGATIKITNSLFEANRKSSSTGNYGAGIYNNGTATIINSTFQKNYARWGTITNDKNLTIINSKIQDNIAYDGASTYKTGSGITSNTEGTNFYGNATVNNVVTVINRCIFTNNDQLDIFLDKSSANIMNNIFNKSTGIVITNTTQNGKINIINNTFDSPIPSSLYASLSNTNKYYNLLKVSGNLVCLIDSNTVINMEGSTSAALELTASNSIISNNNYSRAIKISGSNNTITGNNITTIMDVYAIELGNSGNTTITNNYLSTKGFMGNAAVNFNSNSNTIINNTPESLLIQIDDSTFYKYFDDDGRLLDSFKNIEQIEIIGTLNNKEITFTKDIQILQTKTDIISNNITLISNAKLIVNGIKIINKNNQPAIILNSNENKIERVNITTNNNNTIVINGENTNVTDSVLFADFYVGDESVKTTLTTNKIESNTPTYKNYILSQDTYDTYFDNNANMKPINDIRDIHFLIKGSINGKNFIFNTTRLINIENYENSVLNNCTIKTLGTTKLNMKNIIITNNNEKTPLIINTPEFNISYCNITADTNAINITNASGNFSLNHNNIFVNSTDDVAAISIKNTTGVAIRNLVNRQYNSVIVQNNITCYGPAHNLNWVTNHVSTTSVELINTTGVSIEFNRIITLYNSYKDEYDTIYSINLLNNATDDCNIKANEIWTNGHNYSYAISSNGQSIYSELNTIESTGITPSGIQLTNVKSSSFSNENIKLNGSYVQSYIISMSDDITISSGYNELSGDKVVGFSLYGSKNILITDNLRLNGTNTQAYDLISCDECIIRNSKINTVTRNITADIADIKLTATKNTQIYDNIISTLNQYAVSIDNASEGNLVKTNTFYANEYIADIAVLDMGKFNRVRSNEPENPVSHITLNEKTYSEFFDDNGVLRDDVPAGILITMSGNLYNKVLNITKPLNIVSQSVTLENCTIILDEKAEGTNITGLILTGENTNIQVYADSCNVNITSLNITGIKEIKPILVAGNNNNIILTKTVLKGNISLNATAITIKGNNNTLLIEDFNSFYYNIIGVLLDNATGNIINTSDNNIYFFYANKACGVMVNNSNNNTFNLKISSKDTNYFVDINLNNSSFNMITGTLSSDTTNTTFILLENNSNSNIFRSLKIPRYGANSIRTTPIVINNSNENIFERCCMETGNSGNLINIIEGVGNIIEGNTLITATHSGDIAVLQENVNDTINNIVRYNVGSTVYRVRIGQNIVSSVNSLDTVLLNLTLTYRNGTTYSSPYVPITNGIVTFIVNGKKISDVNVVDGVALLNYTLGHDDVNSLYVEMIYKDPTSTKNTTVATKSITINKFKTKVIMSNITNNGISSTPIVMVIDDNGKIVYDGNVTFTLGDKTETVNIINGIAQIIFNTSNYTLGEYNITAIYNGNNICAVSNATSILNINKYNVNIETPTITTLAGNKVLLTAKVTDKNGNIINSGRVIFKLNGKTLKDNNGNVLYANVENGIATIEYIIPANYSAKDYKLTAVTSDSKYNRAEANTILTINKTTPKAVIPTLAKRTNNTQITIKFTDNNNNPIIGENKVCIKFNGKTITNIKSVNGVVTINIDLTQYKNKQYNLTVVCGENSRYNTCRTMGVLSII